MNFKREFDIELNSKLNGKYNFPSFLSDTACNKKSLHIEIHYRYNVWQDLKLKSLFFK